MLLVCSVVWRNVIVFFHNLGILVIVLMLFQQAPGAEVLLLVPALALVCINGAWIGLICGMACTRYRDLQPLVGSVLQVAIFVTPIFFMPDQLGSSRAYFAGLNPLFHLVDVIRAPLIGRVPSLETWVWTITLAVVGWAATLTLFARFRRRLAFWL
jgi:lipopolysaccharide transport system permease protein